MRSTIAGGLLALALSGPAFAGPLIDGKVSDWGITVGDNDTSNFTKPGVAGTLLNKTFFFKVEDDPDRSGDSYFLGPNFGGQNYDAEFMGVAVLDKRLYIAIVTGQRPDNGFARFSPGDIRIVASDGRVYGIEVGGGAGGAAGAGILTQDGSPAGSTYILDANGFTIGHNNDARAVGSIWRDPTWLLDPIPPKTEVQMANTGGYYVGTADYVYTRNGDATSQHSVIELALDLSIFGDAKALDIYWAPSCGNDVLYVADDLLPTSVPEPGTLAAFAIGLVGWRLVRRRR